MHGLGILYLQESGEEEGGGREAVEEDLEEVESVLMVFTSDEVQDVGECTQAGGNAARY